jgi:hypothetical protein
MCANNLDKFGNRTASNFTYRTVIRVVKQTVNNIGNAKPKGAFF